MSSKNSGRHARDRKKRQGVGANWWNLRDRKMQTLRIFRETTKGKVGSVRLAISFVPTALFARQVALFFSRSSFSFAFSLSYYFTSLHYPAAVCLFSCLFSCLFICALIVACVINLYKCKKSTGKIQLFFTKVHYEEHNM